MNKARSLRLQRIFLLEKFQPPKTIYNVNTERERERVQERRRGNERAAAFTRRGAKKKSKMTAARERDNAVTSSEPVHGE